MGITVARKAAEINMNGKNLVIREVRYAEWPFRVYLIRPLQNDYHLGSFKSFREAMECVLGELQP